MISLQSKDSSSLIDDHDNAMANLKGLLDRAIHERDCYQQELFETNRHATWLSIQLSKAVQHNGDVGLVDRNVEARSLMEQIAARDRYIGTLEEAMWSAESQRVEIERQLELIQKPSGSGGLK